MTWLVERLAELRRHLDHLRVLQGRLPVESAFQRTGFRSPVSL